MVPLQFLKSGTKRRDSKKAKCDRKVITNCSSISHMRSSSAIYFHVRETQTPIRNQTKSVKGSPADKADLEVGDEILEVNGKCLEDATHTEVISHIHQCIRSRTICLRVKRRSGNRLALDLAQNSNVQDAFVIAVEQQARERLERLTALKKIKPVDMSKLSQQLPSICFV
ncbi:Putative p55-3 isoform B [Gryllus bimaculatus]|nr:Putative p55-3 isoform B [Gryllus bimaculatus]